MVTCPLPRREPNDVLSTAQEGSLMPNDGLSITHLMMACPLHKRESNDDLSTA